MLGRIWAKFRNRRYGEWIQTKSGVRFYPLDPRVEDICIEDIAWALSHLCRFGGHSSFPWSVAQHSLLVSAMLPPSLALEGLLHDAAEAYLQDLVSPLKRRLDAYQDAEWAVEQAIATRFELQLPRDPAIKTADRRALSYEYEVLFERITDNIPRPRDRPPVAVMEESPAEVRTRFLATYRRLERARRAPMRLRVA